MIYEILMEGEPNARSATELAAVLNCDKRSISLMVEDERRQGKPICATCDSKTPGYYIPESREEMQRYCNRLQHRCTEVRKTWKACLKTLDSLPAKEAKQ